MVYYDDSTDWIKTDSPPLSTMNPVTTVCWARIDKSSLGGENYPVIWSYYDTGVTDWSLGAVVSTPPGDWTWFQAGGVQNTLAPVSDLTWTFFAHTRNSAGNDDNIYIAELGAAAFSSYSVNSDSDIDPDTLHLAHYTQGSNRWSGDIAYFKVFQAELSEEQCWNEMMRSVPGFNHILHYPLRKGGASCAVDRSPTREDLVKGSTNWPDTGELPPTVWEQGTPGGIFAPAAAEVFVENRLSAIEQQQKQVTAHTLGGVLVE
jgi:hypothetical protein